MFENLASLCTKISKSWSVLLIAVYQEDSKMRAASALCPTTARQKRESVYNLLFSSLPAPVPLYFERVVLKL